MACTVTNKIDWSTVPQTKHGDDVFWGMIVPDEIAKLMRLHEAIRKWKDLTNSEFQEICDSVKQQQNSVWDRYSYDPLEDEAFMLLDTQRVMFANLGVSIAATAENFIIRVGMYRGLNCLNGDGQPHFDIACRCLGCSLKVVIFELPGYKENQRARMLGNCFKHSEGKTSDRYARKYKVPVGQAIEYEKEDWTGMIEGTRFLLTEISQRLTKDNTPVGTPD